MNRFRGTAALSGRAGFQNSGGRRSAQTGRFGKLLPVVLPRRRSAHAGTRRYYGCARAAAISCLLAVVFVGFSHSGAKAQSASDDAGWRAEQGAASFYGKAHQGKRTASGSRFDQNALTAAHPWLPFGTRVRVTLEATGHSVVVTITDRLRSAHRIIDLSREAATQLGFIRQGVAMVSLTPG
jgi:rare lipoprotein A